LNCGTFFETVHVAVNLLKQFFKIWRTLNPRALWRDFVAVEGAMAVKGASTTIKETLLGWPQVTAEPHRFGGTEYKVGNREIGHIHGDWLVDIPFPTRVRDVVIAEGRAEPHHILPESGWISFYLREGDDVQKAIDLFRESYDIAMKQKASR
jgi:hypothetical protein